MMRPRRCLIAAVSVVALVGSGCYGSTEPATNITSTSATLNAHGTANNGPAVTVFNYRPTNNPGGGFLSPPLHWPAGASGSFSQKVEDLFPNTEYMFQLCGSDGPPTVCAQWRTFKTLP